MKRSRVFTIHAMNSWRSRAVPHKALTHPSLVHSQQRVKPSANGEKRKPTPREWPADQIYAEEKRSQASKKEHVEQCPHSSLLFSAVVSIEWWMGLDGWTLGAPAVSAYVVVSWRLVTRFGRLSSWSGALALMERVNAADYSIEKEMVSVNASAIRSLEITPLTS